MRVSDLLATAMFLATILLVVALAPSRIDQAHAQGSAQAQLCGTYPLIVSSIAEALEAHPVAHYFGVHAGDLAAMEIFASPDGTVVVLSVRASGIACIVHTGDGWQLGSGIQTPESED